MEGRKASSARIRPARSVAPAVRAITGRRLGRLGLPSYRRPALSDKRAAPEGALILASRAGIKGVAALWPAQKCREAASGGTCPNGIIEHASSTPSWENWPLVCNAKEQKELRRLGAELLNGRKRGAFKYSIIRGGVCSRACARLCCFAEPRRRERQGRPIMELLFR
jgi:hypothetical protein